MLSRPGRPLRVTAANVAGRHPRSDYHGLPWASYARMATEASDRAHQMHLEAARSGRKVTGSTPNNPKTPPEGPR